jgi:glycosyltransferase involved in cell wall biosynthesis
MKSAFPEPKIHFWAPGLSDFKGGIQVFSGFLLDALQTLYPKVKYDVFLTHDRTWPLNLSPNVQFHTYGHWPMPLRTKAFAAAVILQGLWQRPELVITTHLNFTLAAYQLKRIANIPYWTIAHGFEAWEINHPQLRQALQGADRILAVSQYTKDQLIQNVGIDPRQIEILPNTFHPDRFQIQPKSPELLKKHGLRIEQPVILTVNRLAAGESFHSYDQILQALPAIRQKVPNVHYVIVGTGDDQPRLERLIHQDNLEDCVTLAGFVPDESLSDYYNLCDVFAMPSRLEGFGIVYLEALACGKPVIAGLDGGLDALGHGELGVNLDPEDIPRLAQELIAILQHRSSHSIIFDRMALRQAVIDRFGQKAFEQKLQQLVPSIPCFTA